MDVYWPMSALWPVSLITYSLAWMGIQGMYVLFSDDGGMPFQLVYFPESMRSGVSGFLALVEFSKRSWWRISARIFGFSKVSIKASEILNLLRINGFFADGFLNLRDVHDVGTFTNVIRQSRGKYCS